jgi:hypothetical protein
MNTNEYSYIMTTFSIICAMLEAFAFQVRLIPPPSTMTHTNLYAGHATTLDEVQQGPFLAIRD